MKFRRAATMAGILGTAMAGTIAFGGSAYAGTGPGYTEFCSTPLAKAGYTCFYSDNDSFKVTDNYADGLRTVLHWSLGDRTKSGTSGYVIRTGTCQNAQGAGKTVVCDYDFPEGKLGGTSRYLVNFSVTAQNGANGKPVYSASGPIGYVSGR